MWAEMGLEDEADQPTESYNFRGVKRPPPSTTEFLLELGAEGVMLRRVGQSVTGLRLHKEQDVRADKLQAAAISRDAKKTLELRKLPKRLQKKPPKKAAETSAAVLAGVVAAAPVTTQQAGDAGDAMEAGIAEDAGDAMEAGIAEDAGDSAGAPEPATSVDLSASAQAIVVQAKAAPECGGKGVPKAEQAVGNT
ncbi:hypothetical protein B484DRAFT_449409 [Ochromonadaceae sp. CCMP2298]|nr:hypothetical protein B484DRAFT_449409 [Ochromonadaceae sp. CCMP2298]